MKNLSLIRPLLLSIILFEFTTLVYGQTPKPNSWIPDNQVNVLAADDTYTYIGGNFRYIGPYTGNAIVSSTTDPSPDSRYPIVNNTVFASLADGSGGWYIGGSFTEVGGLSRKGLAHISATGEVSSWDPQVNGSVYALALDGNGNLYIGGAFTSVGSMTVSNAAKLSTTTGAADASWVPNPNDRVNSIAIAGSNIYLAGEFTSIGGQTRRAFAKLGSSGNVDLNWTPNPSNSNNSSNICHGDVVIVQGTDIYVGGAFTNIGGQSRKSIAKLNNTNGSANAPWDPFLNFSVNEVLVMTISGTQIYVGGRFTYSLSGVQRSAIVKLNLTDGSIDGNWDPNLANPDNIAGSNTVVLSIAVNNSNVFVGGHFSSSQGQSRWGLAKLNVSTGAPDIAWATASSSAYTISLGSNNNVLVGGAFKMYGGMRQQAIARLNSTTGVMDLNWNPAITNTGAFVNSMLISGSHLYIGGNFSTVNGVTRNRIAKINLSTAAVDPSWNPGASGGNSFSEVLALAKSGDYIYAGGYFGAMGGITRNKIAKIHAVTGIVDPTWNPIIAGSHVKTIVADGEDIYIGGDFTSVNGSTDRKYFAKLNNTNGAPQTSYNHVKVDGSFGTSINAIALDGDDLYIGGAFSSVTTISANSGGFPGLVKLDAPTGNLRYVWFRGGFIQQTVNSLLVSGNSLFVGGSFVTYRRDNQTVTRNRIARLNTFSGELDAWNPNIDPGINDGNPVGASVFSISETSGGIYVAGSFLNFGPSGAQVYKPSLAQFDHPSPLPSQVDPDRSSLLASPTFLEANGISTSTITVQLKTPNGTNLTSSGGTLTLSTTLGSLGQVVDNNNGTYTAILTSSTTLGTATISGRINGSDLTSQATVLFRQEISLANSTIASSPSSISANGTSTSTITVQLKNTSGSNVTSSGGRLVLTTTLGTLGPVTDNNNGRYTAVLTSSTTAGSATITATLEGEHLTQSATVNFTPGSASTTTSTITASPVSIVADGTTVSTITVQLKDANNNNLTSSSGMSLRLTPSIGAISNVINNNNGTYTATLRSTTIGVSTIQGEVQLSPPSTTFFPLSNRATVTFTSGPPSVTKSTISASPSVGVTANGVTSSTITVQLKDAQNNNITTSGGTLVLNATLGTLSVITDNNNGTYTATITSTVSGNAVITGTLNGEALTSSATVGFVAGSVSTSSTGSLVTASPNNILADGTSLSTITIQLRDNNGNNITTSSGRITLFLNPTGATLSPVTNNNNGTYTATIRSSNASVVRVSAFHELHGLLSNTTTVTFRAPASLATSTLTASPASITANGVSTSTITVQLKDASGNNITVSDGTVTMNTDRGNLTSVTDNGNGTYTALLTSTTTGTATITASLNGNPLTNSVTVVLNPPPSLTASSITASPSSIIADGLSISTITVQMKDANGNNLNYSGGILALSTSIGTLSAVVDNNDGTYTASLASTTAGTATITGTLSGSPLTSSAAITFLPGAASANASTLTATPTNILADGISTSIVTVQLKDANGNNLTTNGGTVIVTTTSGALSAVTGNNDGTYTATLTSSTNAGTATISATLNGVAITSTASVTFRPAPSLTTSTISATPINILADGTSTSQITIQLKDINGNNITADEGPVTLTTSLGTLSTVVSNNNGTYSATLTAGNTAGTAIITGTLSGNAFSNTASVILRQTGSALTSTLTASPNSIIADGITTSTITIRLKDPNGNNLIANGGTVTLNATSGTLSAVTDNNDGTYTATLTSSTSAGVVTITGTLGGTVMAAEATVNFLPGAPSVTSSLITALPTSIIANGTSVSMITVQLKDANGNNLITGGASINISSSAGTLGSVTDNNDGTYNAELTSPTTLGTATVSATLAGTALSSTAQVNFVPGPADLIQTNISVSPASLVANGTSNATVTVQLKDANGNSLTTSGGTVVLTSNLGTLSNVTDNNNGTYIATIQSTVSGDATISGTLGGSAFAATATVTFVAGPVDLTTSVLSVSPSSIIADGLTTSTITVQLKDAQNNNRTNSGGQIVITSTLGSIGSVTDNNNGTYTATLTSGIDYGAAVIRATLNGTIISNSATVTFLIGQDTDGDGVSDLVEDRDGTDPNDPKDYKDSDGDGVPDSVENDDGTDPNDPDDFEDTDGGGVPDYVETVLYPAIGIPATDPNDPADDTRDTDGDGTSDYIEIKNGTNPNDAPTNLSYVPSTINSRLGTAIAPVTPTHQNGRPLSYTISPALPNGLVLNSTTGTISGTRTAVLTTTTTYIVTATNTGGNTTATITIIYNVAPTDILINPSSVNENEAIGTDVGVFSAADTDPSDTHTFELISGTGSMDNASFTLIGNALKTNRVFDFETKSVYSIRVKATDAGGLSFEKAIVITINDLDNEDTDGDGIPDDIEKGPNPSNPKDSDGDGIPDFKDIDSDDDGVPDEEELRDGTDPTNPNDYKDSDGDGVPDYVEARDGTDPNDPKDYKDSDGDGVPDYIEAHDGTDPNDPDDFEDTDGGGVPNYVETILYPAIGIAATDPNDPVDDRRDTDGDGITDYTEIKNGTNPNDAPTNLSYSPSVIISRVGSAISAIAPTFENGRPRSYTISPSLPQGLQFDPATGIISGTRTGAASGNVTYTITATNNGGSTSTTVIIRYNIAPTDIILSSVTVDENTAIGTTLGLLTTVDADAGDTHTYTLVSGTGSTDNASFTIDGTSLKTSAVFDFETKTSYSIRVRVTDAGGLTFEKVFTINVTNVNEVPTDIALSANSVAENSASGTTVGSLSTTDVDAGDTHTYTLVSGTGSTDNASFTIDGTSLKTNAVFDFETKTSYTIRVRVTDAGGLTFEKVFTINVTNVNEVPTDIALSANNVAENSASGTTVGTLSTTDVDAGDTHTYTLVSGTGSTDNASFTIDGTTLKTSAVFDFETKTSYTIRVRVTDAGGLSYEEVFTINITDVDEDNDGDGVMDSKELTDGTDRFNQCSFILASQTVEPSAAWKNADCDNDGLTNQQEKDRRTNPLVSDSDGDGVIDGREVTDNTDPLNQCSLRLESQTVTPSTAWLNGDCNGDGIRNGQNILISMYATRPQLQSDGSYNLRYIIRVRNLRPERVTLTGIQKNLANVFTLPATFRVTGVRATGTGHLTASTSYDGRVQLNVLGAGSGIGGYTLDSVTVDLNLAPNGFAGNVNSTATITGTGAFGFALNIPSTDTTVTGGTYTTAGVPTPLAIPRVDYIIPDAFSPNRDGMNDRFVVIRPYQAVISLQVFNRWGNVVYRNENYNNEWDGRGMSQYGAGDLPEGTYFYLIRSRESNGQVKQFKGSIMLKRN